MKDKLSKKDKMTGLKHVPYSEVSRNFISFKITGLCENNISLVKPFEETFI